jgi:5-methyltetrahydropteroyltriglutamate--homocysteine methyltransferase
MKRSEGKILTTHVGSLPRPAGLVEAFRAQSPGSEPLEREIRRSIREIVDLQVQMGLDVINDGEFGKPVRSEVDYGAWMAYVGARMSGFEMRMQETGMFPGKERADFREFYETHAREIGEIRPFEVVCTGPVRYTGQEAIRRDVDNLRSVMNDHAGREAFMPLVSPASLESLQPNEFYRTQEEYAWALAEAMKEEYAIAAKAGFILQIDDPGIWVLWDFWFAQSKTFEDFRKFAEQRVEMLNYALSGIAPEQVRYHVCWGSWHGPHASDAPLSGIVDLILRINVGAYCVESANVRHENDWKVWRDRGLPDGKILIPGVVSHSTNLLEPPDLVADRIVRYAKIMGCENVIAGTDCGLGGRVHSQIAWAKLKSLVEGAELASRQLWK